MSMNRRTIAVLFALCFLHAGFGQTISTVSPSSGGVGESLSVTITCANDSFLSCTGVASWTSCVSTIGKILMRNGDSIRVASAISNQQKTSVTAAIGFPLSSPTGAWDVGVVHSSGILDTLWKVQGFTVNPVVEPILDSVSPKSGYQSRSVVMSVYGSHTHFRVFQGDSSAENVTGISLNRGTTSVKADSVRTSSYELVRAYFSIPASADTGLYDVQVDQGSGLSSATLHDGFSVTSVPSLVHPLPSGCIAYYPLEGDALDASANGNDGVLYGPSTVQGMYGSALHFDGSSSYVSVPDKGSLAVTNGLSICAWIKPEVGNSWYRVAAKTNSAGTNHDWGLGEAQAGGICFSVWKGSTQYYTNGANALVLNAWNHIAGTWDGATMKIYYNDVLQPETVSVTGPINTSSNPLYIGKLAGNTYYFKGAIDELMIFNRGLSAAEVDSIYRGTYLGRPLRDSTIPVIIPCQPKVTLNARPVFVWHTVAGATIYTLAVASDMSFVNSVLQVPCSDTSYTAGANISAGQIFWHVKSDLNTLWSPPDNFIIQSDTVPFLVRFNGDSIQAKRPQFMWSKVALATAYRIEIAQSTSFANATTMPTQDTTYTPLADMPLGTYYWHVSCDRNYSNFCPTDILVIAPPSTGVTGHGPAAAGHDEFGRLLASLGAGASECTLSIYAINGKRSAVVTAINARPTFPETLKASGARLQAGVYLAVVKKNGAVIMTKKVLQQ
jgi:Concanavalin A-like lectin/glucanases superfamily